MPQRPCGRHGVHGTSACVSDADRHHDAEAACGSGRTPVAGGGPVPAGLAAARGSEHDADDAADMADHTMGGSRVAGRELRACGRRGHVTYRPTDGALAGQLRTETALGEAWRCLRCGDWVLGPPAGHGPADEAPTPPRGRALRQLTILRVLAVERVVRAAVLVAAGYGVFRFSSAQTALRDSFGRLLPALRPLTNQLGVDLDNSTWLRDAERVLNAGHSTLRLVAVGLVLYGLVEAVEGIGLWLARRWGEYLTVVATAAFLPLEVRELLHGVSATKIVTFAINVLAVVYLIVAKRLLGVRGGRAAYERELQGVSLLQVEAAARDRDPNPGRPGPDVGTTDDDRFRARR
jgi:uncharacterized membrane protein (DUF2068 family)